MQSFVAYDGSVHPVRADHPIFPAGWSLFEEEAMLKVWREQGSAREALSEPRAEPLPVFERIRLEATLRTPFSPRQRELLTAWNNRRNMNSALAYLQGRDYRDFGFETLCQVHGNLYAAPCGCAFHVLFDHHKRSTGLADEDIKPLRADAICADHSRFNDLDGAYRAAARDSGRRSLVETIFARGG